jgi:hypothetical protein
VSVWGEYREASDESLHIVCGHSEDKRPDLKQFIISTPAAFDGAKYQGKSQKGKDCAVGVSQSTNDQALGIHDGFQILFRFRRGKR